MDRIYRFDDYDMDQMRLIAQLSPAKRIRLMLEAREVAVSFIRSRLRTQYPNLSRRELNLKLVEELDRAEPTCPQFY